MPDTQRVTRPARVLTASVAARLLDKTKRTGDEYQTELIAFFCERFLYRLGVSTVRELFALKGARLLRVWSERPYRSTRDLDLMRQGDDSEDSIRADLEVICTTRAEPDGVSFDASSIRLETINPEDEHAGRRATVLATCGSVRVPLQVDVGAGDLTWPPPEVRWYPALLDFAAPRVLAYTPESFIAEKLEAIVTLGGRNSRVRDFFDLHHVATRFEFDRRRLAEAIRWTFVRRRTSIPAQDPVGLTVSYWDKPSRPAQVHAFVRRAALRGKSPSANELLASLRAFLLPVIDDVRRGVSSAGKWPREGPWGQ